MTKRFDIYVIDGKGFGNIHSASVGEEHLIDHITDAFRYSDRIEVVRRRRMLPIGAFNEDYEQAVADLKPEFHEDYKCDDEEA